jgi:RNA polymerase sigma factor (sigma-70 family)
MASVTAEAIAGQHARARAEVLSDEGLLERFLDGKESESQEAFRALVERHGPMVLAICRHLLHQDADAEDAFQATFLALARKGGFIRKRRVMAGWLHEVAYRVAVKARARSVRRRSHERQGVAMLPRAVVPNDQEQTAAWKELRPVLHEEVNRLPYKLRIPVILSYLEGMTNEEVAELLQWPVGTVKGRLSRARDLLRSRLTRRGLALSAAFLVKVLSEGRTFAETVPAELVKRTGRLAGKPSTHSPPDPTSPHVQPSTESSVPKRIESLDKIDRTLPKSARFAVILLLSFLCVSVTIGISLVLSNSGNFSYLRAAFSAFIRGRATVSSCH